VLSYDVAIVIHLIYLWPSIKGEHFGYQDTAIEKRIVPTFEEDGVDLVS